jgi:hypothetical protein
VAAPAASRIPFIPEVVAVTIVRVGTNKKYSEGWEAAFGKASPKKKSSSAKKAARKKPARSSAKKPAKAKKR